MAATPYKLTVTLQGVSGQTYEIPLSASDVAGASAVDDRSSLAMFQCAERCAIVDIVASAAGVDCPRIELRANGNDTGRTWRTASLLASIPQPRLARAAGWFPPNTMLQLVQRA